MKFRLLKLVLLSIILPAVGFALGPIEGSHSTSQQISVCTSKAMQRLNSKLELCGNQTDVREKLLCEELFIESARASISCCKEINSNCLMKDRPEAARE